MDNRRLGLARGKVELLPHDKSWPSNFSDELQYLEKNLKAVPALQLVRVDHVGSTAVQDLVAKPIIDMLVIIEPFKRQEIIKTFSSFGYYYRENGSTDDKVFFAKGDEQRRTHYLHVTFTGSKTAIQMIKFRDHLRNDATLRNAYGELKQQLNSVHRQKRHAYTNAKHEFIQNAINQR